MAWYGSKPYVPVAKRRQRAAKKVAALKKSGRSISPVQIVGRKIAKTFWGQSWCDNLEAYSDFANRLPRGRTYARNGSVIDLQIERGRIRALVNGSRLYNVTIKIQPLSRQRWDTIKGRCAGKIDSLVELLQGSISKGVMEIVTRQDAGLFPSPAEISLQCSCPDWATMCKHVAAVLYGVGARLDDEPEMLFTLRKIDPAELVAAAVTEGPAKRKRARGRTLKTADLSSVFGIELDMAPVVTKKPASKKAATKKAATKKAVTKKAATKKAATKKAATKKAATKKAATKKAATKKPVTKKAATKKPVTKKAVTKKAAAKKPVTKKAAAKKAATKKASPRRPRTKG